jgi:DNA-binding response OmpR family regulator
MNTKLLIIAGDAFLAGIYGRKFELAGWDVSVSESIRAAEDRVMKWRPDMVLLDADFDVDTAVEVKRLRALPTWQSVKIALLAEQGEQMLIDAALEAGAVAYLIAGHFVPQEAVVKFERIMQS